MTRQVSHIRQVPATQICEDDLEELKFKWSWKRLWKPVFRLVCSRFLYFQSLMLLSRAGEHSTEENSA